MPCKCPRLLLIRLNRSFSLFENHDNVLFSPYFIFLFLFLSYYTLLNAFPSLITSQGADVYNALGLSENETVFKDLQFGAGDGHLQYYIFNWKCSTIEPNEVGLVLV
jgi:Myristoyl-CoA:protein N-myristoyltransferase, C-terminal domain